MLKRRGRGGSRTRGGSWSIVRRVVAAGNRIARKPYKYGGGHGSYNDSGYDCSGSISYALHGAGLLRTPMASGGFMSYGRPGPWPPHHHLRQQRPRLHGRERPALRHERAPGDRLALDQPAALQRRIRGAPPHGPVAAQRPIRPSHPAQA